MSGSRFRKILSCTSETLFVIFICDLVLLVFLFLIIFGAESLGVVVAFDWLVIMCVLIFWGVFVTPICSILMLLGYGGLNDKS